MATRRPITGDALPPFRPDEPCPKCGSKSDTVRHEASTDHYECSIEREHRKPLDTPARTRWLERWDREHLEVRCVRCGHQRATALAAPPETS